MNPTSYFIAVKIDSLPFTDLFVELQKYITLHSLERTVELSNPLSLHVTLYYIGKTLGENQEKIQDAVSRLHNTCIGNINLDSFGYFGEEKHRTVGIIKPQHAYIYEHAFLQEHLAGFHENASVFPYVPHITLFLVRDTENFGFHETAITGIISKHLLGIGKVATFGCYLYGAEGRYHPSIFIPLHP